MSESPTTTSQPLPLDNVYFGQDLSQLTEGTMWCTSQEGGVTSHDKVLYGLTIGAGAETGEIIHGPIVCTHMYNHRNTPGTVELRNKMVLDALSEQNRIGILVEGKHPSLKAAGIVFPDKELFAIMGVFIVTDAWIDMMEADESDTEQHRTLLVRTQKLDPDDIWWDRNTPGGNETPTGAEDQEGPLGDCSACGQPLIRRYAEGDVFCGRIQCPTSSDAARYISLKGKSRTYAPTYLARRATVPIIHKRPFELLPPLPKTPTKDEFIAWFDDKRDKHPGWKSWACPDCKRLNCRVAWVDAVCRNCGKHILCKLPHFTLDELVKPKWLNITSAEQLLEAMYKGDTEIVQIKDQSLNLKVRALPPINKSHVRIAIALKPEDPTTDEVILVVPTKYEIDRAGGIRDQFADMFAAAQDEIIQLERRRFKRDVNGGRVGRKAGQYSTTYGLPYATRADYGECIPIQDAPLAVTNVIDNFLPIVRAATGGARVEPNSHVLLGYWPMMGMNHHQDNDDGIIGDVVSSVSLGATSVMTFATKSGGTYKTAFTIPLPGTGGIMVQRGWNVNKWYWHKVDMKGLVRFVSTARELKEV